MFFNQQTYSIKIISTVYWLLFSSLLYAQKFKYKQITIDDGLLHNVGYNILQDTKGYLWFGTDEGLSRFDGTEFTDFGVEQGLAASYINGLTENAAGGIWASTKGGELYLIQEGEIWQPKQLGVILKGAEMVSVGNDSLLQSVQGNGGMLLAKCWGDTAEIQCERFDLMEKKQGRGALEIQVTQEGEKAVTPFSVQLFKRKSGQVLLGTGRGVFEYWRGNSVRPIFVSSLGQAAILGMAEDANENLWISLKHKLIKIFPHGGAQTFLVPKEKGEGGKIRATPSGKVFMIEQRTKKLYRLDTRTYEWMDVGQAMYLESSPTQLEIDSENNVWVTTDGGGVYCIFDTPFVNYSSFSGLGNLFVYDIHQQGNGAIVAGTKDGIYRFDGFRWNHLDLSEHVGEDIQVAFRKFRKRKKGNLLAATSEGFFSIGKEVDYCIPDQRTVSDFIIDARDGIGFIQNGEFHQYEDCQAEPLVLPIFGQFEGKYGINCLFEDSLSRLWMGTDSGAVVFYKGKFRQFSTKDGLPNNKINDIQQDAAGNIWLASEGGLTKLDSQGHFSTISRNDGLLSDKCRKVIIDRNDWIWTASPQGLHYFDDQNLVPYNAHTGLVADDINCLYLDNEQRLWIGTSQGISVLDISKPPEPAAPPIVYIQAVKIDGEKTPISAIDRIPFSSKLTIDYTAIAFSDSRRLTFQYRLNKKDAWETTRSRSLPFGDLREGKYTFELRAKKINSEWSEVTTFPFEIRPPWWRSWWFLLTLVLLVPLLVVLLASWRVKTIRKQEEEKTRMNKRLAELELNALQSQMNPHFIFNSLNAIQHFVLSHDVIASNEYLSKFARLMRLYLESSKQKVISLADEFHLLSLYVEMEKLCFEDKFDYELKMDDDVDAEVLEIPSMVIQPFVENAINHGLLQKEGKGHLLIHFFMEKEALVCLVKDDGIGREKAMKLREKSYKNRPSRGMQITNDRIQVLNYLDNSAIQVEITDLVDGNGLGEGTLVRIVFGEKN